MGSSPSYLWAEVCPWALHGQNSLRWHSQGFGTIVSNSKKSPSLYMSWCTWIFFVSTLFLVLASFDVRSFPRQFLLWLFTLLLVLQHARPNVKISLNNFSTDVWSFSFNRSPLHIARPLQSSMRDREWLLDAVSVKPERQVQGSSKRALITSCIFQP